MSRVGMGRRSLERQGYRGEFDPRGPVLIPTLRVIGAKRAPHLPRQGARPKDLDIAFGALLSRFGITIQEGLAHA